MLEKRVCLECGDTFETSHPTKKYCDKKHYRKCVVCGKLFYVPRDKLGTPIKTCSEACRRKSISMTVSEKMQEVVCIVCGKHFWAYEAYPPVCDDIHYLTCKVCGKKFVASKQQIMSQTQTCSKECRYKLVKQTFHEHKESDPEWYASVREHYENTILKEYGVKNSLQSKELRERGKQTCQRKYGTDSFSQSAEFVSRCKKTNQERYGVDWHTQLPEHKEQVRKTCLEKYGVDNPGKVNQFMEDKVTDKSKLNELFAFRNDPQEYIYQNFDHKPTLKELSDLVGIRESSVGWIINKSDSKDLVEYNSYSHMELEVKDYLLQLVDESEIVMHDRIVCNPKEIDIYLPNYKLGIECNPTWTHNSTVSPFGDTDVKPTRYHFDKTNTAESKGVFLFHLFGYDWIHHKEVCKSMFCNLLNKNTARIYARNTQVQEVSNKDAVEFLNTNHRQGAMNSSIRLGLYYKGELVSLMTFSKTRSTIGTLKEDTWELTRFCNKIFTSVVGGASKLFNHFVDNYTDVNKIISYSDRAHTKGNLYETLGFQKIHTNDPGYMWVNLQTDRAYSRINAQKRNIKKFLQDDSIDLSKTETQIMAEHGFVQVYDSGTILWQWNRYNE